MLVIFYDFICFCCLYYYFGWLGVVVGFCWWMLLKLFILLMKKYKNILYKWYLFVVVRIALVLKSSLTLMSFFPFFFTKDNSSLDNVDSLLDTSEVSNNSPELEEVEDKEEDDKGWWYPYALLSIPILIAIGFTIYYIYYSPMVLGSAGEMPALEVDVKEVSSLGGDVSTPVALESVAEVSVEEGGFEVTLDGVVEKVVLKGGVDTIPTYGVKEVDVIEGVSVVSLVENVRSEVLVSTRGISERRVRKKIEAILIALARNEAPPNWFEELEKALKELERILVMEKK